MKNLIIVLFVFSISACSMNAPLYQPATENTNLLQDMTSNKLGVGQFEQEDPEKTSSISLRGSSLNSPYENSYARYLQTALDEELKLAGLWSEHASTVITGKLLDHDVDISGFSVGTARIKADFVVTHESSVIYEKTLEQTHEFESSFLGATAIPNGQNSYLTLVQKLLGKLFRDQDFQNAVRKL